MSVIINDVENEYLLCIIMILLCLLRVVWIMICITYTSNFYDKPWIHRNNDINYVYEIINVDTISKKIVIIFNCFQEL